MGTTITNINILEKIIDYTSENGLVLCDTSEKIHIAERLHIEEVAKKIDATAVLFQRFFDKEDKHINSKPSVYIFDDEELFTDKKKATELHAKIWSAGNVEVYMIVGKSQIDIINARRPAEVKNNVLDIENLKLWSDALEKFNDQRFSAHIFGKGMFWEQGDFDNTDVKKFYNNQLKEANTPFRKLLDYLLETRKFLHDKSILKPQTIDKLIIICLLIKFLEGKDDDNKKHTLRDIYKDLQIEYLENSLSEGNSKFFTVLTRLSEEFNGQIFTILDNEKENIEKANLSLLAEFLRADLDIAKKQKFIWKQYNFNHLPVELISSVYENFLPKQKGVVYTPPFLVNFLIDHVVVMKHAFLQELRARQQAQRNAGDACRNAHHHADAT
ncbi:MAG: hypothetical protein MUE81_11335, partial [Thermoflexibacter sp.]|nr:hypothetical protein [Thermoflexibacter sp.]